MRGINKALTRYLATGEVPAQDAALVVIGHREDVMFSVMEDLAIVEMLSKDLHYRADGKPFFAIHEMADLIWKVGKLRDDISEVFYMGELQSEPPMQAKIFGSASQRIVEMFNGRPVSTATLLETMHLVCVSLAERIEHVKKERPLSSGTTAILDDVSKNVWQAAGFLKRTLSGCACPTDADSVDVEEVK